MAITLWISAALLGIVEGVTEFFPVSSTAHLLIATRFLPLSPPSLRDVLVVAIQSGAMLAAVCFFWKTIWKSRSLIPKIIVSFIPTAIAGLLLAPLVHTLFSSPIISALALTGGGIVFLFLKPNDMPASPIEHITYREALIIGISQIGAIIPGVSRSGATLIGGSLFRIPRERIVSFSFLLAIPTIFGASAVELLHVPALTGNEWFLLSFGTLVAFLVSLSTIRWALTFLSKKPLAWFGWYRIVLGMLLLAFVIIK